MQIRPYRPSDESAVIELWQACDLLRPWNDPTRDIARKLALQPELFLVGVHELRVVATVMGGYDGHRGWVSYLAVAPELRRRAYGREIMQALEERLRALGCPKLNLQVRSDNQAVLEFYRGLGFEVEDRVSLGKRLEHDDLVHAFARRWERAWRAVEGRSPERLLETLVARYAEPHRAYHTLRHVEDCLALLDEHAHLAHSAAEIELALWFHDAIYDPRSGDNEERSAEWAETSLREGGVGCDVARRVRELVLATRHAHEPEPGDPALTVDIDLAILGAAGPRFESYEDEIRREYAWVPERAFAGARGQVLRSFLEREAIYSTHALHARLESPARGNLRAAIDRWSEVATESR